ncbi:MAG TPA: pentapeptide repeat-containing protein [Ktedonobacterales bacterium]|nr:pentapeptide repeat-containing protein [Ktedonobacterales bacterium]
MGDQDDTPPGLARQKELLAAKAANEQSGKPPFDGVRIATWGELRWVMQQHQWSGAETLRSGECRADLRGVDMMGANLANVALRGAKLQGATLFDAVLDDAELEGADLREANLNAARLDRAILEGADLRGAQLSPAFLNEARLKGAHLEGADLHAADLNRADCTKAHFEGADLTEVIARESVFYYASLEHVNLDHAILEKADLRGVNLSGAELPHANLKGAQLQRARMDGDTELREIVFDRDTRWVDVHWNDATLTLIDWSQAPRLGDEVAIRNVLRGGKRQIRRLRAAAYREAARSYRGLSLALRDQGMGNVASRYRLRELSLERDALRTERSPAYWGAAILYSFTGYGEHMGRILATYFGVILTFAGIYLAVRRQLGGTQIVDALVFSISSFHGLGFFPGVGFSGNFSPHDPLVIVGAVEAIIGLFVLVILVATFSRRFLDSGGR